MRRGFEIEEHYTFVPAKEPEKKSEKGTAVGVLLFWGAIGFVSFYISGMSAWTLAFGILTVICFLGALCDG